MNTKRVLAISRAHIVPPIHSLTFFIAVIAAVSLTVLAGCGYSGSTATAIALGGSVQGGREPISGSSVQLYAVGTGGNRSAAVPLLSKGVSTDGSGNFSIPVSYACPSASAPVYVVASGGSPASSSAANPALVLMAMLGPCGSLPAGPITVNEVTTVGSVWPLAAYMTDATHLGSASGDASFLAAVATVPEFVSMAQGSSPGTPTATSYFAEGSKLYSLADILSDCVSSGGGSSCGTLFSTVTPSGASAPSNTLTAALSIAQNPKNNVTGIYGLQEANSPFEPALTSAPADWTLALSSAVATPSISPATGDYTGAQQVTISDATAGSTIHYTTDGTTPTTSSHAYSGPISIAVTSTVQAIAVLQGSQSAVASSTLTITAPAAPTPGAPAAKLEFLQQPSSAAVGATISPAVTVAIEDSNGNPVTSATNPVTLALTGGSGLAGTLTATPQNGVATFSNLSVGAAGSYTLAATSPNLTSATSSSFTISAAGSAPVPVAKLAFIQQPTNALTGSTISPAITVAIQDSNGNTLTSATNPVTLALTSGTGLAGTLMVTPQNGIATFSNLSVSNAGSYTLAATSANLTSATSTSFTISTPVSSAPLPPAKLAFVQDPSNALTGAVISPAIKVLVEDSNGNAVSSATSPITIGLTSGTGLAGTLTATPQNGIATFANLSVSAAGSYTLSASSPELASATSTRFTISAPNNNPPAQPVKLAFLQQPTNAQAGATISPSVTVVVEDSTGNPVTAATNPVTLALEGGTGLGGTLTATPKDGVATFNNLSIGAAGSYTLSASSADLVSATSNSFTISAGSSAPLPPAKLAFVQQPSNALTGATIAPAVTVAVQNSNGNTLTTATNPVTLTLTSGTGLTGTLTATPQNGVATFNNLSVDTAGSYTLSASSPSLASATSSGFTISAGSSAPLPPAKLAFVQQPSNALTGATIAPAVTVAVQNSNGNTVTSATNPVTLTLTSGSGLTGTLIVTPQNGVATFSTLSVGTAGSYTLSASSPNLTSATSGTFTISAGSSAPLPPAKLAFVQQPSNALTGATIAPAVTVAVQNSNGNTVTSATNPVTLTLTSGSGLAGTLTVTPQNGVATFSTLSVGTAGSYTLSASSPNLTSATSGTFTISAGSSAPLPPAKLAFVQQPSNTITGTTISPAVTVAVQDSNGNTVTSATNPVTLALTSGTGLAGTLTATPQNGVATFSTLSVSNAGSYTLVASSANLTSATSTAFTISAPSTTTNGTTVLESTPISITAAPGGTFEITYNWQAAPVAGSYSVFVDFIDSTGTVQFQDNEQPPVSPAQWNGTLSYTHTVTVPASAATGTYKIVAGLQSSSGYLSMTPGTGVTAFGNGYQTGTLTLAPTCSITSFGAVGDGKTDNLTAIQNAFNNAATNHCIAFIPAGTFAYNGNITANGIAVQGTGAASILAPLSLSNQSLTLSGSGGSIYNLSMVSTATVRLTTPWSSMIWVDNASNYYIENILINDGSSTGIISQASNGGYILNNTVKNTLADSITQVSGSYNITVSGNRIMNSGDDGISDNSYVGDPGVVHDITIQGNTVLNNKWGRGLEVSGGSNIKFIGNYVDNTDGYSNVYVASESEWNTQSVSNVTVSGNTLVDGGPNQGSTIVYNSEGGSTTITGVTISGNQYVSPQMVAVQLAGAGSETGIQVENNTDYSNNQFSTSSDPAASDSQSGNQVLAPSAYSTPIVPAGGGCNFNGC